MDFSLLLSSYATVWSNPEVLLMTFIGALGGVLLGAIPGMTATMGVALLIPFSFGMDLIPSIGLLLGIYCGGMYGGSISAILIHAPGTPAAAATLLDGYPMCKKGQAGKALSVAMFASFCGGVIGALVLESFGVGGLPGGEHGEMFAALRRWCESGRLAVFTTQVPHEGCDLAVYEVGRAVGELPGVLEARDMTPEAVAVKLMWALGQTEDREKAARLFETPIEYDIM